ncbi:MAG: prolipoprotein diacylglyceryl transferase [Oceanococcus sp.]
MLIHPNFDPVAISLGPLQIHWYGLSYLAGFALFWWIQVQRLKLPHVHQARWNKDEISDVLFTGIMGVIVGGRVGYVLFYNFSEFASNPLYLFKVWEGGMSFHGGLVGVLVAQAWHARKFKRQWWTVLDFIAAAGPVGLLTGRLGNFINAELWGRVTDVPWGMVFPHAGPDPRHPSQLYEAGLEGFLLLIVMLWFTRKPRPMMAATGLFLIGYGCGRTFVEFFRTPDAHIGFLYGEWLTMGMLLSAPMWMIGGALMVLAYRREATTRGGKS